MYKFELNNNKILITNESNLLESIKIYLDIKAPQGKIVIFFSEIQNFTYALQLGELLSKTNKIIYYHLTEKENLSIDNLCHLFNLHEDIRLSISLDSNSFNTSTYFSIVRNIPIIYITNNLELEQIKNYLLVKNGESVDLINNNKDKCLLVDQPFANLKSELYAYLTDKAFSVFDYYITSLFTNEPFIEEKVNNLLCRIENAKSLLLNETNVTIEEKFISELENIININLQSESIFLNNATNFFSILLGKSLTNGKKLYVDCLILHYLKKAFYFEENIFPPSYNERANQLAKLLNIKNAQPLIEIKKQIKLFNNFNPSNLNKIDFAIKQCEKYLILSKKEYLNLGGKTNKISIKEKEILKYTGDFLSVNILSAIREGYLIKK